MRRKSDVGLRGNAADLTKPTLLVKQTEKGGRKSPAVILSHSSITDDYTRKVDNTPLSPKAPSTHSLDPDESYRESANLEAGSPTHGFAIKKPLGTGKPVISCVTVCIKSSDNLPESGTAMMSNCTTDGNDHTCGPDERKPERRNSVTNMSSRLLGSLVNSSYTVSINNLARGITPRSGY